MMMVPQKNLNNTKIHIMATACEIFYTEDYLRLNIDVKNDGMDPIKHWDNFGKNEKGLDGTYNRRWNEQCPGKQTKPPIEFIRGSSTPTVPTKRIVKVVATYSDGTTQQLT